MSKYFSYFSANTNYVVERSNIKVRTVIFTGCVFTVANQSKSGLSVKCTASEAGGLIVHYSLYILMVSSVHY